MDIPHTDHRRNLKSCSADMWVNQAKGREDIHSCLDRVNPISIPWSLAKRSTDHFQAWIN